LISSTTPASRARSLFKDSTAAAGVGYAIRRRAGGAKSADRRRSRARKSLDLRGGGRPPSRIRSTCGIRARECRRPAGVLNQANARLCDRIDFSRDLCLAGIPGGQTAARRRAVQKKRILRRSLFRASSNHVSVRSALTRREELRRVLEHLGLDAPSSRSSECLSRSVGIRASGTRGSVRRGRRGL